MRDDAEQFTPEEQSDPEAIRRSRELDLGPDDAWELVGSSAGLERWLGDEVDLTIAPGETGTIRDGEEVLIAEVESVDPGRRVSLRWWSEERGATIVDLVLEPAGEERTRLIVTEVPARLLEIPAAPAFIGGGASNGGPQMQARARSAAPALALA